MSKYFFDGIHVSFREVNRTFWSVLSLVVKYFLASVVLALLYYAVIAIFVSTDTEKRLHLENKMYQKVYPEMKARGRLVADVINGMQVRDNEIYKQVFYCDAPELDPVGATGWLDASDTIPDRDIVRYASIKSDALLTVADRVEAEFQAIAGKLACKDSLPPLAMPLEGISYMQVGASVGEKMTPFYKVQAAHEGVDIIAPQGDPVYAAADGRVTDVVRSRKGRGNVVEITHGSGYVTRYCHLGDISVSKGQTVRKGRRIGEIGISGNSFAPHLHYEVIKDSVAVDPVHYFFASVTPYEYANMLYMSVNTGQSLD